MALFTYTFFRTSCKHGKCFTEKWVVVTHSNDSITEVNDVQFELCVMIKGVQHLLPPKKSKISMFCALSQNYQHLFEKIIYTSHSKLSKELKNSIKIKVGQEVPELLIQKQHFDCFDQ